MERILVVDDEDKIRAIIRKYGEFEGYEIAEAHDGMEAVEICRKEDFDLIILDVMMPGKSGYEVARELRASRLGTPILMLTARSALEDRIAGLDAGADYYLTKPFDTRELTACVRALLRRQGGQVDEVGMGKTCLDLSTAVLSCGDRQIRLSAKEFDIMRLLFQSGAGNLSKEMILEKVWGYDSDAVENHVEVYIGFLRKKLLSIGSDVRIESIRRMGYHLEVAEHDL